MLLVVVQAWDWTNRLGSKTAYRPQQNASNYTTAPSTCSAAPVHAEMVARHGIRYATKGSTAQLIALQTKLRALPSTAPAPAWIRTWTNPVDPTLSDMLAVSGQNEHYEMGKRMKKNYPSLFSTPYHPSRYNFQSTWVPRAQQSGISNVFGFLEGTGSLGNNSYNPPYLYTHPMQNDTILRFFDSCPKYDDISQQYAATIDAWGQANLGNVLKLLQSKVSDTITYSDMLVMYSACGYEVSLKNNASLMCSLFDDPSLALMDLFDEFDGYFLKGPGVELSYMISSPLIADILQSMQTYVNAGASGNPMTLRFAHAETVSPVAAYMGLFAGGPPLAFDVRPSTLFNRSWDDSQVMPYGANMLLLMYSCSDGYKVKMLYNEKETVIPGCGDTLYCPWTKFFALNQKALTFDFQAACKRSSTNTVATPKSVCGGNCTAIEGDFCVPGKALGNLCCKSGQCVKGLCVAPCRGAWCAPRRS